MTSYSTKKLSVIETNENLQLSILEYFELIKDCFSDLKNSDRVNVKTLKEWNERMHLYLQYLENPTKVAK